jgi:hypothetical protein
MKNEDTHCLDDDFIKHKLFTSQTECLLQPLIALVFLTADQIITNTTLLQTSREKKQAKRNKRDGIVLS